MSDVKVLYFGCKSRREMGHFLYAKPRPEGTYAKSLFDHPLRTKIDGVYCDSTRPAGDATLVWVDGFTIVAFNDYSADTRPGSNSAFVAEGRHGADELLWHAKKQWPEIWDRFDFEVRVVDSKNLEKTHEA